MAEDDHWDNGAKPDQISTGVVGRHLSEVDQALLRGGHLQAREEPSLPDGAVDSVSDSVQMERISASSFSGRGSGGNQEAPASRPTWTSLALVTVPVS